MGRSRWYDDVDVLRGDAPCGDGACGGSDAAGEVRSRGKDRGSAPCRGTAARSAARPAGGPPVQVRQAKSRVRAVLRVHEPHRGPPGLRHGCLRRRRRCASHALGGGLEGLLGSAVDGGRRECKAPDPEITDLRVGPPGAAVPLRSDGVLEGYVGGTYAIEVELDGERFEHQVVFPTVHAVDFAPDPLVADKPITATWTPHGQKAHLRPWGSPSRTAGSGSAGAPTRTKARRPSSP